MKTKLTLLALVAVFSNLPRRAQDAKWTDDWKPSGANIAGQQYPKINSACRAQFKIKAPEAKDVSVNLGKPLYQHVSAGESVPALPRADVSAVRIAGNACARKPMNGSRSVNITAVAHLTRFFHL
jgi:hypothetical protein